MMCAGFCVLMIAESASAQLYYSQARRQRRQQTNVRYVDYGGGPTRRVGGGYHKTGLSGSGSRSRQLSYSRGGTPRGRSLQYSDSRRQQRQRTRGRWYH